MFDKDDSRTMEAQQKVGGGDGGYFPLPMEQTLSILFGE